VVSRSRALGAKSVALSFDMPPRHAGEPPAKPVLLTTLEEKRKILKSLGVDQIDVLIFDRKTQATPPEDFFRQTVVQSHRAAEMVVGPRVAFGRARAGRLPLLRQLGRKAGVRIGVVSNVVGAKGSVSSRRIRALLTRGSVDKANALLGYPYSISGRVIHGDKRGRRLGFPTANIRAEGGKMLPRGVFWVKVLPGDALPLTSSAVMKGMDGLCNIGVRPTFSRGEQSLHCEVFLLRGGRRLYGRKMRVVFLRRIRAERRFRSPAALGRQIARDVRTAEKWRHLYKKAYFSL
jgi:riboflavin kinase/FMN adenylyltransferase